MQEKEFKFEVESKSVFENMLIKLKNVNHIDVKLLKVSDIFDTYFDTDDYFLFRNGFGCRKRVDSDERYEVKFQPEQQNAAYMNTSEWVLFQGHEEFREPETLFKTFFLDRFNIQLFKTLAPRIVLKNYRTVYEVRFNDLVCEFCLDDVLAYPVIREEHKQYFLEVELELKSPAHTLPDFMKVRELFTENTGLIPSRTNKIERTLGPDIRLHSKDYNNRSSI